MGGADSDLEVVNPHLSTREERNARARTNQRISRARRLDYITSLEARLRQYESSGVAASQEVQASARGVEKQNSMLRSWLVRLTDISEGELYEWLRMSSESAEQSFESFLRRSKVINLSTDQADGILTTGDVTSVMPTQSTSMSYASERSYPDSPFTDASTLAFCSTSEPHSRQTSTPRVKLRNHSVPIAQRTSWTDPQYSLTSRLAAPMTFPTSNHYVNDPSRHYTQQEVNDGPNNYFGQDDSPYTANAYLGQMPHRMCPQPMPISPEYRSGHETMYQEPLGALGEPHPTTRLPDAFPTGIPFSEMPLQVLQESWISTDNVSHASAPELTSFSTF